MTEEPQKIPGGSPDMAVEPRKVVKLFLVLVGISVATLLLVVAISFVLLPKALDSEMRKAQAAAIGNLEKIVKAQDKNFKDDPDGNGKADYADLATLGRSQLIPKDLARGFYRGYHFDVQTQKDSSKGWWALAWPRKDNIGAPSFYVDQDRQIYYSLGKIIVKPEQAARPEGLKKVEIKRSVFEKSKTKDKRKQ